MRIRFIQNLADRLRGKRKPLKLSEDMKHSNNIAADKSCLYNTKIHIDGKNNTVIIESSIMTERARLSIYICGDNNSVIIKKGFGLSEELTIQIGQNHPNFGRVQNSTFCIGENTCIESAKYFTYNSNTHCNIGSDCMFACNVTLYNTDAHPIFDNTTGEVINKITGIDIGSHCWLGMNSTVLKNSLLPDNSILGYNAVYSGDKAKGKTNCAFAGNPARLVKENINWDLNGAKCGYIDNVVEKDEVKE